MFLVWNVQDWLAVVRCWCWCELTLFVMACCGFVWIGLVSCGCVRSLSAGLDWSALVAFGFVCFGFTRWIRMGWLAVVEIGLLCSSLPWSALVCSGLM